MWWMIQCHQCDDKTVLYLFSDLHFETFVNMYLFVNLKWLVARHLMVVGYCKHIKLINFLILIGPWH